MRRNLWIVTAICTAALGGAAFAQQGDKAQTPEMPAEQKAMMEAMAKMCTIGDQHKQLEAFVGEWTTTCKMRFTGEAPWEESAGTCTAKMVLDGRFLHMEHKGTMMGQPHVGISTTGYDTMKGKFVSTWMDNMCTGITMSEGTYDPSTKAYTYHTQMPCPMKEGDTIKVRYVIKMDGKDKFTFEWFETQDGKEVNTMIISYVRKGAA